MKLFFLMVAILFSHINAQSTFYVDGGNANANDSNAGTESEPWKTIYKAVSTLEAGETVYIKAGTYDEEINIESSGEKDNYITISAFPGDEQNVIITKNFNIHSKNYIKVTGLRRDLGHLGFSVRGPSTGVILDGNYTYGTSSSGISVWGVPWGSDPRDYDHIKDIIISNNTIEKACDGGYDECITLANGVKGFKIIHNTVKNGGDPVNGGEGIDIKEGCSLGIIAYNHIFNLNRRGIYLDGGRNTASKPIVENIHIYNNSVHDQTSGGAFAIMTEGPGDVRNIKIYNNLFYNNNMDGIMYYKHPEGTGVVHDITAINNVCYNNGRNGILNNFWTSYNMVIRNNICYNNTATDLWLQSGSSTSDHNLVGTDPLFVNASTFDFHLQSNSPAINSGTQNLAPNFDYDKMQRPYGDNIDIGAYEYGSTSEASLTYNLTINDGDGSGSYSLYSKVSIVADTAPQDKKFNKWVGDVGSIEDINSSETFLIMPDSNITISAEYRSAMPDGNGAGIIYREVWTNIRGKEISKLLSNSNYPDNPIITTEETSFEIPEDNGNNYGTRMRGYLHPPINGLYTFWLSSNNEGKLWLSTNENPDSLKLIASVSSEGTGIHDWDNSNEPDQKSVSIELQASNSYYVLALHKASINRSDNFSVAWVLENSQYEREVIEGEYLSPDKTVDIKTDKIIIPVTTKLIGNYPNPFNPTTTIEYAVHKNSHVSLIIYNTQGQKLITLINQKISAGYHEVVWDASEMPSGIYFSKLLVEGKTQVRKILLLK